MLLGTQLDGAGRRIIMTNWSAEAEVQSIARATKRAFFFAWEASEQEIASNYAKRHRKQLRRIARLNDKSKGNQKFEIQRTLTSFSARFCAAARVLSGKYRKTRKSKVKMEDKDAVPWPTFEEVMALAKRAWPYYDPKEPFHTRLIRLCSVDVATPRPFAGYRSQAVSRRQVLRTGTPGTGRSPVRAGIPARQLSPRLRQSCGCPFPRRSG